MQPTPQVTIFVTNSNRPNYIEEEFIKRVPTLQINTAVVGVTNNSFVRQPTTATLFVVLLTQNHALSAGKQYEIFLETLTKGEGARSIPSRPKCFVIFFSKNSGVPKDDREIEGILNHGWSKKFLDLTVATVRKVPRKSLSITISYYNPYRSLFVKQRGINNALFPDKLKNMNGYEFKVIIDARLYKKALKPAPKYGLEHEIVTDNNGIALWNFREKLNFTIKWKHRRAIDRDFNMYFAESTIEKRLPLSSGRVLRINHLGMAVPDIGSEVWKFYSHVVVITFVFIVLLALTMYTIAARTLKLPLPTWHELNILLCMLGSRSIKVLENWKERILYPLVVCFSLALAMDAILMITELRLDKNANLVDSFEELRRFNVSIFTSLDATQVEDEEIMNLKDFIRFGWNRKECMRKLHKKNDRICAMGVEYLRLQSAIMKKDLGRGFRIIDLIWTSKFKAFLFEIASPYVKKHNDLLLRLFEAGIVKIADANRVMAFYKIDIVETNEVEIDGSILFTLCDLMVLGFGCSVVVFVLEVVYEFLKSVNAKMLIRYYSRLLLEKIEYSIDSCRLIRPKMKRLRKIQSRI